MTQAAFLELASYRRAVSALYARVRASPQVPAFSWREYCIGREKLFETHAQSALTSAQKKRFKGLSYYEYNPSLRFIVKPEQVAPETIEIHLEIDGRTRLQRFARVCFSINGEAQELSLYWVMGYGGGIFLPFRDATNDDSTYGGGRYLLDTIKGADLGQERGKLTLDFNYAYNPSCAYNARWHCPLAPAENTLPVEIYAGELVCPDPV
jgi:uncharacterized protein (DUF1684 family)